MLTQMPSDNSNPQQGAYQPRRGPPNRRDERKLFVGGLPANITNDQFQEFFEQYGQLVDSVVMFDRETHRSRGFGFVTFEDPNVCRQILMMGNESADPSTAMSLVGKIQIQDKMCEVKAATPREGTRDRREDAKKMPLYHQNPSAVVAATLPPPPPPVMYGYPLIGYPANIPPAHAMYYPAAPYMEYSPPNSYDGYMEYPQPAEPLAAGASSGTSMITSVQPPHPIGVPPPQPLLPAVLAVPQPQFVAGGIPAPLAPSSSSSDVPVPMPYIGIPMTAAYGMPAAAATPGAEHHSFHYWNGQQQHSTSETA